MRTRLGSVFALALAASPAGAATRTYAVEAAESAVTVHVGKAGLFKFAGHDHEVRAPASTGEIKADAEDLASSTVRLVFETGAIRVSEKGEPPEDLPKVQETMAGPKVLDVLRFPTVTFESRSVSGRKVSASAFEVQVTGDLTLHGITHSLRAPVRVEIWGDSLVVTGQTTIRHSDFGLEPVSVAGVVKVKNELEIDIRIVARARP